MPESDAHIPGMNAVSFVAYCGELAGLPQADAMQRAHEVLYYVGLGEARYRNIDTYSTGMKQRIKLAQALVHDPDLLFLDEPTNGMDPKGRDEMLELIRDIAHNKGINLILSSHLLPDVEYTCDYVVVLDKGAVATAGPIAALKGHGGRVFELRVKGETAAVRRGAARRRVSSATQTDEDIMRVFVPEGLRRRVTCSSWRRAHGSRCVTCAPSAADARRRVRATPSDRSAERVPIHDQGYRRYGGRRGAARRSWRVIARAGRRWRSIRQRRVARRCCWPRGCRSWCAPCRSMLAANFQQAVVPGADAADVSRVSRLAEHLRLLRDHPHRRRA